jgi:CheY-like chemotaxis protein
MAVDYAKDLKILVVDDVQVHRYLMTSGIARLNPFIKIDEATSLDEAISKLSNVSNGQYNVVISDWNMIGGGGDELVKWMRSRANFRRVPFIMISGNTDNEDIIRAFMELGVDAYVVKPFTPQDLYQKMIAAFDKLNAR